MIFAGPASMTGAFPPPPAALATMVTSSEADKAVPVAVNRRTYVPAAEKLAVVACALTSPKVTLPGPLILDQVRDSLLPAGKPSSEAVPLRLADAGKVMVWLGPALTVGG